ncbi:NDP-hexose 2,3-dehydratase family protein [Streptomyces sp. NPDC001393]
MTLAQEAVALRPRHTPALGERLARSAATTCGAVMRTEEFHRWLQERRAAHPFRVDRIPLADLDGWSFEKGTGNLVHHSGRFFTVEGLHVVERGAPFGDGPRREWQQPVIRQPEVGVLGILAKEIDGVLHFLMQAKMEPGNPNLLQLSPTVQATRSNYTRAHGGSRVNYLEYFVQPGPGRVIADVLQSEHGAWFYRKSNRNMIVETVEDVPLLDDFCWLTLGQIGELLHEDNVVNMDSRTVLSCVPYDDGADGALLPDAELLSWFTGERARHDVQARCLPLADVAGWRRGRDAIEHNEGRYFAVVAVSVQAGSREVTSWTQPMIEPVDRGLAAFLTCEFDGVPHVLVHARAEGGFLDTVELTPTVQCVPRNYSHLPDAQRPPFLDEVRNADPARVRYRAVHSEEGGRFLGAESEYMIVAVDEHTLAAVPPGYAWATPAQLTSLTRHGHYLNVQARTLLACLHASAVRAS